MQDEESLSSSDSEVSSEHVDYERDIAPLKRRHKAENSCVSVIPNADLTDLFQIQDEYCIFVRAALALLDEQEFKSAPEDVTEVGFGCDHFCQLPPRFLVYIGNFKLVFYSQ